MSFSSLLKRLRNAERAKGPGEATLTFEDDTTRAIRIRKKNQVKLCLDAFAKMRSYPPEPPTGIVLPAAPPEPQTKNDVALEVLGRAKHIEGPKLLQFVHALARTVVERRKEKASGNALTPHGGN